MMKIVLTKDIIRVEREPDVVMFRNRVKEFAVKIGMGTVNQTKLITAASELVRNMLKYGGGGIVNIEVISEGRDNGIRLTFKDRGPGIKDISLAMKDGYSSGKSLGIGLPGAKRLVSEFNIKSVVNEGTEVMIIKWKNG
jgi:serine/threonine-protein kinase RsbT